MLERVKTNTKPVVPNDVRSVRIQRNVQHHLSPIWGTLTKWPIVMPTLATSRSKIGLKYLMVPCACVKYKGDGRVWQSGWRARNASPV